MNDECDRLNDGMQSADEPRLVFVCSIPYVSDLAASAYQAFSLPANKQAAQRLAYLQANKQASLGQVAYSVVAELILKSNC